jgi:hypothetical protein
LWGAWEGATLVRVNAAGQPRRLQLEVQFEAQPIQGRVYDGEGGDRLERAFSGWLGLISAIEAARSAGPTRRRERREERR